MKQSSSVYIYVRSNKYSFEEIEEKINFNSPAVRAGLKRWTWKYQFPWYHEEDVIDSLRKTFDVNFQPWKSNFKALLEDDNVYAECHWVIGTYIDDKDRNPVIPDIRIPNKLMKELSSFNMSFDIYFESQVPYDEGIYYQRFLEEQGD